MHPFNIIRLKSVDSTNAWAKNAIIDRAIPANTVIVAETQTAGRGQMLTKWHDEPGKNLLFTLLVEPKRLTAGELFQINAATSLAIIKSLQSIEGIQVKWPNDIVVNGKKLAGLLIETTIKGSTISSVLIGLGLNVNQLFFPKTLNATSIHIQQQIHHDLDAVLFEVLDNLNEHLLELPNRDLVNRYNEVLYGKGQQMLFEDKKGLLEATVIGATLDGLLELQVQGEKSTRKYRFKEVKWKLNE